VKRTLLSVLVLGYCALHQDWWFWRTAHPLTLGFSPAGLTYHGLYALGAIAVLGVLIRYAWPEELEREAEKSE
jgi:hypothetical protein